MSFSEIVLLLFVALILFGPEDLPVIARALGKIVYQIRKMSDELTKEFRDVADTPKNLLNQTLDSITKPTTSTTKQTIDKDVWKQENKEDEGEGEGKGSDEPVELLSYDDEVNKPKLSTDVKNDDPLKGLPESVLTYEKKTDEQ